MKFGVNTFLWTINFHSTNFAVLPDVKSHGFDGIEVALIRPRDFEASAIRKAAAEHGLACTVCSVLPQELNLISDEKPLREKTIAHLADCIQATAAAGANLIAGPLYAPVGFLPGRRRTVDEWNSAIEGYQRLAPVLDEFDVDLAIEPLNRFETYFLNLSRDAAALCSEVNHPRIGILWDSFHANIEEKNFAESLRQTAPHLKHVHACENDRGTPGTGHVDWHGVFEALRELHYDGWLTIESFAFALGDLCAAASIWRDLAATPEEIAWRGVKFLKQKAI